MSYLEEQDNDRTENGKTMHTFQTVPNTVVGVFSQPCAWHKHKEQHVEQHKHCHDSNHDVCDEVLATADEYEVSEGDKHEVVV